MKKGSQVKIAKSAMDFLSQKRWGGRIFTITKVFVPEGNDEAWARLDGNGGIWPLRMLKEV